MRLRTTLVTVCALRLLFAGHDFELSAGDTDVNGPAAAGGRRRR